MAKKPGPNSSVSDPLLWRVVRLVRQKNSVRDAAKIVSAQTGIPASTIRSAYYRRKKSGTLPERPLLSSDLEDAKIRVYQEKQRQRERAQLLLEKAVRAAPSFDLNLERVSEEYREELAAEYTKLRDALMAPDRIFAELYKQGVPEDEAERRVAEMVDKRLVLEMRLSIANDYLEGRRLMELSEE